MIVIRPNGRDWNYIADLTGDNSWRSDRMRGYFAKMSAAFISTRTIDFSATCSLLLQVWRWLALLFDPELR